MNIIILSLCIVILSLVIGYIMTTSYNIKHENNNKVEIWLVCITMYFVLSGFAFQGYIIRTLIELANK